MATAVSTSNVTLAKSIYESFNNRNFNQATALVTEEAEMIVIPFDTHFRGPKGFGQFMQGWATAFPDCKVVVQNIIAGEEGVAVEFTGQGTHKGPLKGPAGEIPATGKYIKVQFVDVFRIRDGRILGGRSYFDSATMIHQLGLTS
jgi:steroid delta-isomerase-like uncharacterized protein